MRVAGRGVMLSFVSPATTTRALEICTAQEADAVAVTSVYAAREEPDAEVSGKLVVDSLSDVRPGVTVGWTPSVEQGADFLVRRARPDHNPRR